MWSNVRNQDIVKLYRKKGKFSQEFIEYTKEVIKRIDTNILLVDLGGIISQENAEILGCCDYCVVLSNDKDKSTEWEEFAEKYGTKILASLDSVLDENLEDEYYEDDGVLRGRATNLKRGKNGFNESVGALARKIISEIEINMNELQDTSDKTLPPDVLDMNIIAEKFGMINSNGVVSWNVSKLKDISYIVSSIIGNETDVKIYNARPNWLACAVEEIAKNNGTRTSIYDMQSNKYVQVNSLKKGNEDNPVLKINVAESEESVALYIESKKTILSPEDMKDIVLPELPANKRLYINGRLPHWVTLSIARSYDNKEKSIYQFQEKGFVRFASSKFEKLGELEKEPLGIDFTGFVRNLQGQAPNDEGGRW